MTVATPTAADKPRCCLCDSAANWRVRDAQGHHYDYCAEHWLVATEPDEVVGDPEVLEPMVPVR